MASGIETSPSLRRCLQDKPPSNSELLNILNKEAAYSGTDDRLSALVSHVDQHTKDGGRAQQSQGSESKSMIKDGYELHHWLHGFVERVDSAMHAISTLEERNVLQPSPTLLIADLGSLGKALDCMSTIFAGVEGAKWDRELLDTATKSEQRLKPLFQLLPQNLRRALTESYGSKDVLRRVTDWASNDDEFQRLQSHLADHVKLITSRLDVVKVEFHGHSSLATDAVMDDASTTTYTDLSKISTVTKPSSMSSYANDANGLLRVDQSSIASKFPGYSASDAASVRQRLPSDSDSVQYSSPDADPNKIHLRNEQSALRRERSVHHGEVWTACKKVKNPCDGETACASCMARDIACVGYANDPTRRNHFFVQPSTDLRRELSGISDIFVPTLRSMETILESEETTTCIGLESDANRQQAGDVFAHLGEGSGPVMENASCELCSACAEDRPRMTSQLGIAGHSHSYAMNRWLRKSDEEAWTPFQATGKCSSCGIDRRSGSSGRIDLQQLHVHCHNAASNTSEIDASAAPSSSVFPGPDSLVASFNGLSFLSDGQGKCPSIQPVTLANGAQESPAAPNESRDNSDPSDNIRGKRKASERDHHDSHSDGDSGGRDDSDKPDEKKRKHPRDFEGYFKCIYRNEALDIECSKLWPDLKTLIVHLKSSKHRKTRDETKIGNWGKPEEKWKRLYEKLRGRPEPRPHEMHPENSAATTKQSNDNPYMQQCQNSPSDESDHLEGKYENQRIAFKNILPSIMESSNHGVGRTIFDRTEMGILETGNFSYIDGGLPFSSPFMADSMIDRHWKSPFSDTINPIAGYHLGNMTGSAYSSALSTTMEARFNGLLPATSMGPLTSGFQLGQCGACWACGAYFTNSAKPPDFGAGACPFDENWLGHTTYLDSEIDSPLLPYGNSNPSQATTIPFPGWAGSEPEFDHSTGFAEFCTSSMNEEAHSLQSYPDTLQHSGIPKRP